MDSPNHNKMNEIGKTDTSAYSKEKDYDITKGNIKVSNIAEKSK